MEYSKIPSLTLAEAERAIEALGNARPNIQPRLCNCSTGYAVEWREWDGTHLLCTYKEVSAYLLEQTYRY